MATSCNVLVLYDRHGPVIEPLAAAVCEGASQVAGATPIKRRIREAVQARQPGERGARFSLRLAEQIRDRLDRSGPLGVFIAVDTGRNCW